MSAAFDPTLDLVLTRWLRATPEQLWRAWSDPEILRQWWCPKPVEVTDIAMDFRPGGRFFTEMTLPDGTVIPGDGCFLEVIPEQVITWTSCLKAGYRPSGDTFMTARISMVAEGAGTAYRAHVMHATQVAKETHDKMGFFDGWGTVMGQLEDIALTL